MEDQLPFEIRQQPIPTWYTATLTPQGTVNAQGVLVDAKGRQIGRPVKYVWATSKKEVEAKLKGQGYTWESIRIVKGRDPGLTWTGGTDRHTAELKLMIGGRSVNIATPHTPAPMWVGGDPNFDPDATARTMWAKFMDESSHGLSVSEYPRFLMCDVDGYSTLPLPCEAVKDEKRWDGITAVVCEQLTYWKAVLQERIERVGKIKRRSAEDADQLRQDKATLKELEAFDGWTYQKFVEQLQPERKPNVLDLDNRRLYRLSNGRLLPVSDLGPYLLRVDFWRRLLTLWDGPMDKRADAVRAFLDHHHRNGGKPEQFRDLVKDTLPRLRKLAGRELLADKLEGWLQLAVQYPAEGMPTDAELAQLEGMRWVLVRCVRKPTAPWWKEHHMVKVGEIGMEDMGAVKACPECYQFIPTTSEEARGIVERMVGKNPGLRLSPLDGSEAHPLDVRNTYRTFNDGRLFAEVNGSSGAGHFLGRLRHEASQLTTRATNVDALLDHHLSGPNPVAFVEFIRGEVLAWKSGRGPSPNSLKGWLALNGKLSDNALTEVPWQVDRCERWLELLRSLDVKPATTGTPKPAKEWTGLMPLALFHALRWAANKEANADIPNDEFAEGLARDAGYDGKGAGHRLLLYYNTYCSEAGRTGKVKLNSAVLRRYDEVIAKCNRYPEALALAQAERTIVRNRSQERED